MIFNGILSGKLWHKLRINDINGKMYNVIFNMYSGIKSRVVYNGQMSEYFSCNIGVRQGENMSPFLFSLYLNDLQQYIEQRNVAGLSCITDELENELDIYLKLFVLLYADDTVLFSDNESDLQLQLDIFHEYCRIWKLKVNADKTKIVIFSSGRLPRNFSFTYNGNELEIVNELTYLGLNFSRTGSFMSAKKILVKKANKAMYEVLKKGRLHNLSVKSQYDLFDKIVKPILLYGCEIWGFSNTDIIEKVHLKFCKLLLNLKKSTPNFMIYGELGIYPMSVYIQLRMVNFWSKIVNGDDNKIAKIIYRYMFLKTSQNNFRSDWLKYVKDTLDRCGYSNIWLLQGNFNSKWLSNSLKQKLFDQFQQKWRSDIDNSPKGLSYKLFKQNYEFEEYLNILNDKDRITYCRFRTGNHKLPIETGRWNRIDRNQRYCNLCQGNEIGDEFHYILPCRSLANIRKQYLYNFFLYRINILKFGKLFQLKNISKLKHLCKFIREINSKVSLPG